MSRITDIWKATGKGTPFVIVQANIEGTARYYSFKVEAERLTEIKLHSYRFLDSANSDITRFHEVEGKTLQWFIDNGYKVERVWRDRRA